MPIQFDYKNNAFAETYMTHVMNKDEFLYMTEYMANDPQWPVCSAAPPPNGSDFCAFLENVMLAAEADDVKTFQNMMWVYIIGVNNLTAYLDDKIFQNPHIAETVSSFCVWPSFDINRASFSFAYCYDQHFGSLLDIACAMNSVGVLKILLQMDNIDVCHPVCVMYSEEPGKIWMFEVAVQQGFLDITKLTFPYFEHNEEVITNALIYSIGDIHLTRATEKNQLVETIIFLLEYAQKLPTIVIAAIAKMFEHSHRRYIQDASNGIRYADGELNCDAMKTIIKHVVEIGDRDMCMKLMDVIRKEIGDEKYYVPIKSKKSKELRGERKKLLTVLKNSQKILQWKLDGKVWMTRLKPSSRVNLWKKST